jgi:hypothetical protein
MSHCVESAFENDSQLVEYTFRFHSFERQVIFRANVPLNPCAESYVAAALLPCMRENCGLLDTPREISERLLESVSLIQDIHTSWDPALRRVTLPRFIPVVRLPSIEGRVGLFFSGGVDSCYSLLKHQDEITDLVFVRGFDLEPGNKPLCDRVAARLREVADAFGKRFVEVETTIRDVLDPFADWCSASHGAAMASIGHLLYPAFGKIYMAAPHTYANLFPCGSHPMLDPLWSTEGLEFVHDGCETMRVEKVSMVATSDVCLRHLRVCWRNTDGAYNCGKCEKCLRTMINLRINGTLERCSVFDRPLSLRRVARLNVTDVDTRSYVIENLRALEESGVDPALQRALQRVLRKPKWWLNFQARIRHLARSILKISPFLERPVRKLMDQ